MYKNWIGLCDLCGEKSLVNYGIAEWDKHPEPNLLVMCQDRDSCVVPPSQDIEDEILAAEAAQEEAACSVWK